MMLLSTIKTGQTVSAIIMGYYIYTMEINNLLPSLQKNSHKSPFTAKLLFHRSPTRHSDYTMSRQWQCSHQWQLPTAQWLRNLYSWSTVCTVVWNNYLLTFWQKMSYFTLQNVGNPVQIIKYVELSKFQPILELKITFVEGLFTLKPFKAVYYWYLQIQICDKMRALFMITNYWLWLNIDYVVWIVLKVIIKFCRWQMFHLHNGFL